MPQHQRPVVRYKLKQRRTRKLAAWRAKQQAKVADTKAKG